MGTAGGRRQGEALEFDDPPQKKAEINEKSKACLQSNEILMG